MFFFGDMTFVLLIPVMILAFWTQSNVQSVYQKFKRVRHSSGMTGAQTAQYILRRNGINDVSVREVQGTLSDHYNPRTKEVCLSSDIYHGASISSVTIAAHEVGHAMQHANGYVPLNIRASILPVAQFGSGAAFPLFLIGFFFSLPFLMDLGIIFFAGAFLFQVVTLPVEFNASSRAVNQLSNGINMQNEETVYSRKVLRAAALTYVASTLVALVHLIRLIILRGGRD